MKVFISHQKRDHKEAKQVGKFLENLGIEIYLDEYDSILQIATKNNDSKAIVSLIKEGIESSTHMICIISKNSQYSQWIPFEIGYGYEKLDLRVLTLKGMNKEDLPDYIKIVPIIRDLFSLNDYIKDKLKISLIEKGANIFENHSHVLENIMDKKVYE